MTLRQVDMWQVVCNICGAVAQDGNEYWAWSDASDAVDDALNWDWIEFENGHYCPDCTEYDEDSEEYKPKKEEL